MIRARAAFLSALAFAALAPAVAAAETVDVNSAGVAELVTLPGIGPVKAQRIVESRRADGPFRSVEDLARVKGIGKATVAKLRPLVRTGKGGASPSGRVAGPKPGKPPEARASAPPASVQEGVLRAVDLNTANEWALRSLPGVGPSTARAILADRKENGPFASVDDLARVRGIGAKKVAKLRPFAKASSALSK